MPPADLATQRAYTLRLRPADAEDDGWWEPLWRTHEAVNRGARVFGDFLLTLRGGLSHELAATEDGAQRRQRGKGPEQGNADVETQRKYRRRLLALSWLSVESEEGAPSEYKLGDQDSPVAALRDILAKRGLSGADIEDWASDCLPALEATIRDDACWVNRSRAFDDLSAEHPDLTCDSLFAMFPRREDYLDFVEDEGSSQFSPDFKVAARNWVSRNYGTGEKGDFSREATALGSLAGQDLSAFVGRSGQDLVQHFVATLGDPQPSCEDPVGEIKSWSGARGEETLAG